MDKDSWLDYLNNYIKSLKNVKSPFLHWYILKSLNVCIEAVYTFLDCVFSGFGQGWWSTVKVQSCSLPANKNSCGLHDITSK